VDDVSAWRARVGQHDGYIISNLLLNVVLCDQRLFIPCPPLECYRVGQMSMILEDRSAARQDFLFQGADRLGGEAIRSLER